jgi:hypothetical protein
MRHFRSQENPMSPASPSLVRPFAALRPAPGRAQEVIAPPYDVLNTEEARVLAEGRPWSFLHISKPEIDLPPGTDPYAPQVYAKAAENLKRMLDAGVLKRDEQACYYAYRLIMGEHVQVGLVAAASVADYDTNRIRKHEFTRPDKEDDRVRQIEALNAQTGPVLLAYPHQPEVDGILAAATQQAPDADGVAEGVNGGGVRHTLWVIRDAGVIARLTELFRRHAGPVYRRWPPPFPPPHPGSARRARRPNPGHGGRRGLQLLPVGDLPPSPDAHHGLQPGHQGSETACPSPSSWPGWPRNFMIEMEKTRAVKTGPGGRVSASISAAAGCALTLRADLIPHDDPVGPTRREPCCRTPLIAPVLGIADPRRDKRIDFVGGIRGLAELEKTGGFRRDGAGILAARHRHGRPDGRGPTPTR